MNFNGCPCTYRMEKALAPSLRGLFFWGKPLLLSRIGRTRGVLVWEGGRERPRAGTVPIGRPSMEASRWEKSEKEYERGILGTFSHFLSCSLDTVFCEEYVHKKRTELLKIKYRRFINGKYSRRSLTAKAEYLCFHNRHHGISRVMETVRRRTFFILADM